MMVSFDEFQEEVGDWSNQNFGSQPAINPTLGLSEEFGELIEHVEKHSEQTEHELDCVGDMLVYLADVCHRRELNLQAAYENEPSMATEYSHPLRGISVALGRLARSVLKQRQSIRLDDSRVGPEAEQQAVSALLGHLSEFARTRGYTLDTCVQVAWYEEVRNREWNQP